MFITWLKSKRKNWYNDEKVANEKTFYNNSESVAKQCSTSKNIKARPITTGGTVNTSFTLKLVKQKVAEIIKYFGVAQIEKTCKWFLLWNNR